MKLGILRSLLFAFFVLGASACGDGVQEETSNTLIADAKNVGWVARHDLTAAQYQAEFNYWVPKGYKPISASGYTINNVARYAVIFDKDTSVAWIARHGLNSAQYQAEFNKNVAAGYRPTLVNGYTVNGVDYYIAVWEKKAGPAWIARHGLTSAQYQAEVNKQLAAGYRLTLVSGYSVGNADRYAALWEKVATVPWSARHGLTAAQYQTEFNNHANIGYRLVQVTGYTVGGVDRYAAIWEKRNGLALVARHGLTSAGYQAEFNKWTAQGYRPFLVDAYGAGASARFAAIFHKVN